jgi:hypothetical protein
MTPKRQMLVVSGGVPTGNVGAADRLVGSDDEAVECVA